MNPYPPHTPRPEYRLPPQSRVQPSTWYGDRIYVLLEVITTILSFTTGGLFVGTLQRVMFGSLRNPSNFQGEGMQTVVSVAIVLAFLMCLPVFSLILVGIWKGMQWAYVFLGCLLGGATLLQLLSLLKASHAVQENFQFLALVSAIIGMSKLSFCVLRLSGKVGPRIY